MSIKEKANELLTAAEQDRLTMGDVKRFLIKLVEEPKRTERVDLKVMHRERLDKLKPIKSHEQTR